MGKSFEDVCLGGCGWQARDVNIASVGGLYVGVVWEADTDALGDWLTIGAWSVKAQKMAAASSVRKSIGFRWETRREGSMGRRCGGKFDYRVTSVIAIAQSPKESTSVFVALATSHVLSAGSSGLMAVLGELAVAGIMVSGDIVSMRPTVIGVVVALAARSVTGTGTVRVGTCLVTEG